MSSSGLSSDPEPDPRWLNTGDAAARLGITPRTLYRFINEGHVRAYRFGRVIRLKQSDVDAFIEASQIAPGTLDHLYPEAVRDTSETDSTGT